MTVDEFQRKYHNYRASTKKECLQKIARMEPVYEEIENTFRYVTICPVEFPGLGWCLMIDTAVEEVKRLGIL